MGGLFATPTFNKVVLDTVGSRTNVFKPVHDYKYENFTYCKELLRKGISARKYHYSKKGYAIFCLTHCIGMMTARSWLIRISQNYNGNTVLASLTRKVHVPYLVN